MLPVNACSHKQTTVKWHIGAKHRQYLQGFNPLQGSVRLQAMLIFGVDESIAHYSILVYQKCDGHWNLRDVIAVPLVPIDPELLKDSSHFFGLREQDPDLLRQLIINIGKHGNFQSQLLGRGQRLPQSHMFLKLAVAFLMTCDTSFGAVS